MTPSDKATASNEELLRKVIEAQMNGGCNKWDGMAFDTRILRYGEIETTAPDGSMIGHILEILLDTHGCKAAYGEQLYASWPKGTLYPNSDEFQITRWENASNRITDAWHSGEGNNVRAALESAVSFLPYA